jgi:predicted nucleotidyltransferase
MSTVPRLPPLVARVVPRLARALAADRIMLFGSYAKGVARGGSDVDLLVVIDTEEITAALQRRVRQLTADCFPPVDVVLCTRTEIDDAEVASSPFLGSILGSAVCLFERVAPER